GASTRRSTRSSVLRFTRSATCGTASSIGGRSASHSPLCCSSSRCWRCGGPCREESMNLRFDLPWAAVAAVVLSLLSALTFRLWHRRRVARLSQLGVEAAIERLPPGGVGRAPVARAVRVSAAIGLAALAYAGPRWGSGVSVVRTQGIDVVLAMDASLSMLAQDERPSRLERMKQ